VAARAAKARPGRSQGRIAAVILAEERGIVMFEMFKIVEKDNHLAVHGIFDYRERAERFLREVIPEYVKRGYFMDKTLTADSFVIVEK
jgi:hypothetical protein